MDYRTIVEGIKSLSPEEQRRIIIELLKLFSRKEQRSIITELSDTLKEMKNSALDQLLPISNDMLAIEGHTLDMEVEGKSIYGHLAEFKERLLIGYSKNEALIDALPELSKQIKKIKFHTPTIIQQEQNKNIKDRTIITGNQEGNTGGSTETNGRSTKTGVQGVTYMRKAGFTQDVPQVENIIKEIQKLRLSKDAAVMLFVVIAGLPMSGEQNSDGEWYDVGRCGSVACFIKNRNIVYLYYNIYKYRAGLRSGSKCDAMPSFSASNL